MMLDNPNQPPAVDSTTVSISQAASEGTLGSWEFYGDNVWRMKVSGGYIYKTSFKDSMGLCFVPDIDLQRYQSHLRDAYNQGIKDGKNE